MDDPGMLWESLEWNDDGRMAEEDPREMTESGESCGQCWRSYPPRTIDGVDLR
ncbi:hypothetical protein RHMOL_Rhmol02G0042900 [Rhododendron molle]|uniref:Uncharacterized protein n=1 Tax=Rhododendron molle TaxID=49168 RepID=A0ACC0PL64_RHOML|nr:hypothetical protein RHMOL_Rhmol02G0042900 [Rhododendron molle]